MDLPDPAFLAEATVPRPTFVDGWAPPRLWAEGGSTALENLVRLCHRHHWSVHEGGWKVVRAEDQCVGVPRLADTNGGVLTTPGENYLTRRFVSGWARTANRRRAGAE
jgi:hypothetical protein